MSPIEGPVAPTQVFAAVGLVPGGSAPWVTVIYERGAGVYVIEAMGIPVVAALPPEAAARWLPDERVVYIGKATSLRKRLGQFYRHRYGQPRPHRGGQSILLLGCPLVVWWAATPEPREAERAMIGAFEAAVGRLPFGNGRR